MPDHFYFRLYSTLILFWISMLVISPDNANAQHHTDWSYNLGMYEVNIRQYTEEGTFDAFVEHLDRLEEMGVGILWLMPIHPIGEENRKGTLGSYYSVKDFKDTNPEFGSLDDFENLVQEAHDRGMYVLMDWVPNHTAWDNYLTEDHPEFYETDGDGNFIIPPGTDWSDVIQLDHDEPGLLDYMVEAMQFWIEDFGIDGFRFDAVSHADDDFLEDLNKELLEIRSDLLLLAENDGPHWHDLGYHQSFGWGLYGFGGGILRDLVFDNADATRLYNYAEQQLEEYPEEDYRLFFTQNHDENSWEGTSEQLFGDAAEIFKIVTAIIPGMPLIYSGQEAGLDKQLEFFEKDEIEWRDHPNEEIYTRLLYLKRDNRALWNGAAGGGISRIGTSNESDVLAFLRKKEEDEVVVLLNLSEEEQTFTLNGEELDGDYRNLFNDEMVDLTEEDEFTLSAWDYKVFETSDTDTYAEGEDSPEEFELVQNYPNPFNATTEISFSVPETDHVTLEVYDLQGRRITTLVDEVRSSGTHTLSFDAADYASGMYLYRLETSDYIQTRKMMLVK